MRIAQFYCFGCDKLARSYARGQLAIRQQAEQTWAPNNYNGSILYDYVVVMGELE